MGGEVRCLPKLRGPLGDLELTRRLEQLDRETEATVGLVERVILESTFALRARVERLVDAIQATAQSSGLALAVGATSQGMEHDLALFEDTVRKFATSTEELERRADEATELQ